MSNLLDSDNYNLCSCPGIVIKKSILLAQSQDVNRVLISGYLLHAGYKVYELEHASEIIPQLKNSQVDLVLLDIELAGLENFSDQLKSFAIAEDTPMIFLSESDDFDIDYAFDLGAIDYVLRPIKRAELLVKIKTHLHTAELKRQLIASESQLKAILHHSPIAFAYTDLELNVLKTNSQFWLQFGYNEDIKKLSNILAQPSDEKNYKIRCLNNIFQNGHVECEIETQHKNGKIYWTFIRGKLIDQEDPQQGLVWTLDDISSRKAEQEQLQLAATVFEVSGEAMIIIDENGMIENINPAMQKLIGYRNEELHIRPIALLFDLPANQQTIDDILSQVIRQQQWQGELWLQKKCREQFPARIIINSIKRPDASISHYVVLLSDISEHRAQEQELRHRADHDPLTGLPNRNEFFARLNEALAIAKRHQYNVALLYLDLDGFKPINDTLGHGKGDEVLQDVATRLRSCVREVDTVARLGGDEFVIILNGTSDELVTETADRLIQSLTMRLEESLHLSVSIGIAVFPNDAVHPAKLLQYADKAMYKAKQQGKQTYCWHNARKLQNK